MNNKIKLYIPKNDIYEPFTCRFKYAVVVTEPEYSEYNQYPIDVIYSGTNQNEEDFFDDNKRRYVGRYSFYNLTLDKQLTENCDIECEICNYFSIW